MKGVLSVLTQQIHAEASGSGDNSLRSDVIKQVHAKEKSNTKRIRWAIRPINVFTFVGLSMQTEIIVFHWNNFPPGRKTLRGTEGLNLHFIYLKRNV